MVDYNPREIISINCGQAGVQLASAVWELLCIEHGINPNGRIEPENETNDISHNTFFSRTRKGYHVPRLVVCDLEPTCIDEIRTGPYRDLHHPDNLQSGFEDAANNFARGNFTVGKNMIQATEEKIRRLVEKCDMMQGFLFTHSFGGGTGSGFNALIMEKLTTLYGKRAKASVCIVPSPSLTSAVVEPYNALLTLHFTHEHGDLSLFFDNESMYNICKKQLIVNQPTYPNINRLASNVISSLTAALRFENVLYNTIDTMCTNLVPYPKIRYTLVNYAPLMSEDRATHHCFSVPELTRELFEPCNQLVKCNLTTGQYMACSLHYRGDISLREINISLNEIKQNTSIKFVDWCPTGFKVGVSPMKPVDVPYSNMAKTSRCVAMFTNSTASADIFRRINTKFNYLFGKRAFVHHFVGEGMEEGEFNEAYETTDSLRSAYEECGEKEEGEGEAISEMLSISSGQKGQSPTSIKSGSVKRSPQFADEDAENVEITEIEEEGEEEAVEMGETAEIPEIAEIMELEENEEVEENEEDPEAAEIAEIAELAEMAEIAEMAETAETAEMA